MSSLDSSSRYDRNLNTLSAEDQDILSRSKVVVAGLGGLGGGVCEMLARVGVGHLVVIDHDRFDASNLNRQLFSREDLVGESKAAAAKERIRAINSEVKVSCHDTMLDESNMFDHFTGAHLVMDCLDSIDTRFTLQDAARKAVIPIVSGAIAGVTGQVTVIFPSDTGYELIYGKRGQNRSRGVETQTGNISYCAMMVASLQSSECIKVLLKRGDILQNKLLIAELWANSFDVIDLV